MNNTTDSPRIAVIPVAGRGTRWLPITRTVPKELLPVWKRTSASYAFEEAVNAGCNEIIFVISPDKEEVLHHFLQFDSSDLGPRYSQESFESLHTRVTIKSCIQHEPKGLGHAILCARNDVGDRPFSVLLPDEVLMQNGLKRIQAFTPAILLMEVPYAQRRNYGIVKAAQLDEMNRNVFLIEDMVEKPEPPLAPSSLAITGRYTFTHEIFDELERQTPGLNGEIQLTDAMKRYNQHHPMHGILFHGKRHDVGQPLGLVTASLDFALKDPAVSQNLRAYLTQLVKETPSI